MGYNMANVAEGVPVGAPVSVDEDQLRRAHSVVTRAETQRYADRIKADTEAALEQLKERMAAAEARSMQRHALALDAAVSQARARVDDTVQQSIAQRLPGAFHNYLLDSASVASTVQSVCLKLEDRVVSHAERTVSRVASDAALVRSIEASCVARLEERTRWLVAWSVLAPFVSAGAAVAVSRWWGKRD